VKEVYVSNADVENILLGVAVIHYMRVNSFLDLVNVCLENGSDFGERTYDILYSIAIYEKTLRNSGCRFLEFKWFIYLMANLVYVKYGVWPSISNDGPFVRLIDKYMGLFRKCPWGGAATPGGMLGHSVKKFLRDLKLEINAKKFSPGNANFFAEISAYRKTLEMKLKNDAAKADVGRRHQVS
jgi:hypothetical protein